MVVLCHSRPEQDARSSGGDHTRECADGVGVHLADGACGFRRVTLVEHPPEAREKRLDLHALARVEDHIENAIEKRLEVEGEAGRVGRDGTALRIGVEEAIVTTSGVEMRGAQELPRVAAHEEGQIGLRAHEREIGATLRQDDLAHRQCERGIGPVADGDVNVHVTVGRVHIRRDEYHCCPAITRLDEVMVGGDVRVGGIAMPQQDAIGVEDVVGRGREGELSQDLMVAGPEVVDRGVDVEKGAADHGHEAHGRDGRDNLGSHLHDDGLGACRRDGIEHRVGGLPQGIGP